MRRLILILILALPVPLAAQEAESPSGGAKSFLPPPAEPQAQAPPAGGVNPSAPRPRPEGSMVGYIDDAVIGSRLRLRVDAGFHAEYPDRAEFFYAKCGCYQALVGSGLPATDATAPGPKPGVATDLNFQQLYVRGEYAPRNRFSVFAEIPVRWLQPKSFVPGFGSFSNQSGLGDIRTGVKVGLLSTEASRLLTFQLRVDTPSGDESKGLGTGHTSIEPALLYSEPLTSRLLLESEFSIWHPFGGSKGVATATDSNPEGFAGNVLFYGIGPSYQLYSKGGVRFGPVVELAGWHVLSGYETVWISPTHIADKVAGTDIVNLKMGVRTAIGRNSIYLGYGRALTDDVWYKDIVRFEYRRTF